MRIYVQEIRQKSSGNLQKSIVKYPLPLPVCWGRVADRGEGEGGLGHVAVWISVGFPCIWADFLHVDLHLLSKVHFFLKFLVLNLSCLSSKEKSVCCLEGFRPQLELAVFLEGFGRNHVPMFCSLWMFRV